MRILFISAQHHPSQGGIGAAVARTIRAVAAAGWHVELMTRPGLHYPPAARVHEIETPDLRPEFAALLPELRRRQSVRPYRYALWSRAVARRLLELDSSFDAIEFVDAQGEGFAALGSPVVRERLKLTALIVHAHTPMFVEEEINGADPLRFGRAIYHEWERRAITRADGVIATSRGLLQRLPTVHESAVIPYPIEAEHAASFVSPAPTGAEVDQAPAHTLLFIGTVQPRKGPDIWARSLNIVLREGGGHPTARAVLIGPDTPTAPDGLSMIAHVQRLIEPKLLPRFQWLGALLNDEVQRWIGRATVVVVPSRFESFSLVAAEALLCGTPVIVSDRCGIVEHVSGLSAVAVDDVAALAAAQVHALREPVAAKERATRLRARLMESCSPQRHIVERAKFIASLRDRTSQPSIEGDSLAEMEEFIAAVEAEEVATVASSASE